MKSGSNLEQVLRSGEFAVTGELGPPKNGDFEVVRKKARILKGHVDAVNITDCQTAIVRMSSLTAGLLALAEGVEPVMQMTCRDRNRIGMQADILGASALGLRNLLCLTGDHQKFGNHPQSKGVFDMDSIQLLGMVRDMRDEKRFQCGEDIKSAEPRMFLGCAANPFADPFEYRAVRLGKKVAAGADFVQTQIIYNVEKFARFMEMVRDLGLHERCYILAGVTPPKSLGMARYMKKFVPGLDVTDDVIDRLSAADDQREEGIDICVDIINQVKEIPGVAGVHVMAIEWEEAVPEIVKRAGISNRPAPCGIEPLLVSSSSIEEAVEEAGKEAAEKAGKELESARAEAQASRELVVKEKERVGKEITDLKKQIEEAKGMASRKEAEVQKLTAELERTKAALAKGASSAVQQQAAVSGAVSAGAAGTTVASSSDVPLSSREQNALKSLNLGLEALRKVLGLDENQFEALKRFLEAEFMLQLGNVLAALPAPGPVQAPAVIPAPAPEAPAAGEPVVAEPASEATAPAEEGKRDKEVVNLIAKANVLLHKNDNAAAADLFRQALAINPDDVKAKEGLARAEGAGSAPAADEGMPPCPEEFSQEEWNAKWVIRYTAKGNVSLFNGDRAGAVEFFKKALALDPENQMAKKALDRAEAGETIYLPEVEASGVAAAPAAAEEEKKEGPAPVKPEVKVEEKPAEKATQSAPAAGEKKEEPGPEPKAAPPAAPISDEGVGSLDVAPVTKEETPLAERSGSIPRDQFIEKCSGSIKATVIGDGDKAITVGGEDTIPFYTFEGDMANRPVVAYEVLDTKPEEWPDVLAKYYSDVMDDPVKWAQKCVGEYGARAICLSMLSTDPNGANRPSSEAAQTARSVVEAVDVPVILWGCGNADKDTETLREVTSFTGNRKVCIAPLSDANYRSLGATAMALQLPVVAATPIDVNLAKQLNILLENLGMSLENILMDPSIGAVGYGLEYTYSVMERIRLAALQQNDEKLSVPFIVNLGREVWKAKEAKLPSDSMLGDQERRAVLIEAITASSLLMAGGELMIMRHPKAVALTEALIEGLM